MRAAWYEKQGPAHQVLTVGDMPDPSPGPDEVRVRIHLSGLNPGDIKKREGWLGSSMPFLRVIPHSDGSGFIDAVGSGCDRSRIGHRVWVYGAQSYRAFGTAAAMCVVPERQAVDLPAAVSDAVGAALGIPGITAHRAVFAGGAVEGCSVLVHGVMGAVGSLAAQLARNAGAQVIGTVRRQADTEKAAGELGIPVVPLDDPQVANRIRALSGGGIHRVIEVDAASNLELDAQVVRQGAVIAAYSSSSVSPSVPFWPLLFANITLQLLGSDDFPREEKDRAARELTLAAGTGTLTVRRTTPYPLTDIASAHQVLETGHPAGRVLIEVD